MLNKIFDNLGLKNANPNYLMKLSTKAAITMAACLFFMKLFAWIYTGSVALKLGCLDSLFDIALSFINFLILHLITSNQNCYDRYKYGYDKAAALASLNQSILILFIIAYTLYEAFTPHEVNYDSSALLILIVSLTLSFLVISFQKYVIKKTKSMIVQADMLHYQTDLLINCMAIFVLILTKYYPIWWIDSTLAIFIGLYLLKSILKLFRQSLQTLMDKHLPITEYKHVINIFNAENIQLKDINITFSGIREIINATIILNDNITVQEADQIINRLKDKLEKDELTLQRVVFLQAISQHSSDISCAV